MWLGFWHLPHRTSRHPCSHRTLQRTWSSICYAYSDVSFTDWSCNTCTRVKGILRMIHVLKKGERNKENRKGRAARIDEKKSATRDPSLNGLDVDRFAGHARLRNDVIICLPPGASSQLFASSLASEYTNR